jgi:anti-sigma factor RsiW
MAKELHEDCWKLLPWFVTGRLSASDQQRIERHLEECAACRAELAEQRELCMHIRRDEPLLLAPQASLQKMMARIDQGEPEVLIDHDEEHVDPVPTRTPRRWLAIAAAVQTIMIVFLLAVVGRQTAEDMIAPKFNTLSSPATPTAPGPILRVVFKPDTSAAQMQSLLHSVHAQVVAGPTEAGVYTLQLDRQRDSSEVSDTLEQVRSDGSVIFAEHVSVERRR